MSEHICDECKAKLIEWNKVNLEILDEVLEEKNQARRRVEILENALDIAIYNLCLGDGDFSARVSHVLPVLREAREGISDSDEES